MKNWLFPLAVLGLSCVGLMCASERGRKRIHDLFEQAGEPDVSDSLFPTVERQLEVIQRSLEHLADALESPR